MKDIIDYIESRRDEYLEELRTFLRIPSISTDSNHRQDMQRAAEYVKEQLDRSGMTAEIVSTDGHPIVYGPVSAPGWGIEFRRPTRCRAW